MNSVTRMAPGNLDLNAVGDTARDVFVRCYPSIREELRDCDELGLLLVACEGKGVIATHWMPAAMHGTTTTIVGRHDCAGLPLPPRARAISLRHLAITCRATSLDDVRLRVLDLGTAQGFRDEHGYELRSVTAEGSIFLQVGMRWLMVLVTGSAAPTSDDPEAAYELIPERVHFKEHRSGVRWRLAEPGTPSPQKASKKSTSPESLMKTTVRPGPEPVSGGALIDTDEEIAGRLTLEHRGTTIARNVGARALDRGVLIGRYERCQFQVADEDAMLSRVHLLLLRDEDGVIAVDTASSNGTWSMTGEPITTHRLEGNAPRLRLPSGVVLTWEGAGARG